MGVDLWLRKINWKCVCVCMCVCFKHLQDWCPFPGLTCILCSVFLNLSMTTLFIAETSMLYSVTRLITNKLLFMCPPLPCQLPQWKPFSNHKNVGYCVSSHTISLFYRCNVFRHLNNSVALAGNAEYSRESLRLGVLWLLWHPWYSLQAVLYAAVSWTRPIGPWPSPP